MIDSPSPSFEMALQEEFKRFYLAGIETGRRLERELMQQTHFEGELQARHKKRMERKCKNACGFQEPYGFVPEADCPVHDRPLTKEQDSDKIKGASEGSYHFDAA